MSRPSSVIRPRVTSTNPAIICSVVVLPQPDGPSSDTNSPFSTDRLTSATACRSPNDFVRSVSVRNDMAWPLGERAPDESVMARMKPTLASQIMQRQFDIPSNDMKTKIIPMNGIYLPKGIKLIPSKDVRVIPDTSELKPERRRTQVF